MRLAKPSHSYHLTDLADPGELPRNLDAVAHRWIGAYRRREATFHALEAEATTIEAAEATWAALSTKELGARMRLCREQAIRRPDAQHLWRAEGLGLLREAARRETGLFPFRSQLLGVLCLREGCLAEMATGEGKTLVAALAAILAGWTRRPCHVVTVNDYLAARDAAWFQDLFTFAGLRTAAVVGEMEPTARRLAYQADVVYATSKELNADFLRDRLVLGRVPEGERRQLLHALGMGRRELASLVQRGLHTAIVDEADSVLIDEAVTPLILSAPNRNPLLEEACRRSVEIAEQLIEKEHYTVDDRFREVNFNAPGRVRLGELAGALPGLWKASIRREELIRQALTAHHFYRRGKEYIVEDDAVIIIDEATGRKMPGRSWRQGLHQIIEAREGVPLSPPSDTVARLSFQRFFRYFRHLSGMTGTAWEAADELWQVYRLPVIRIPTHRPVQRMNLPDRAFATKSEKWWALAETAKTLQDARCPVLIGVRSVRDSDALAMYLDLFGVSYQQLSAVRHQEEAAIIQRAGEGGRVTLATNMAGRGTDIRITEKVAREGGLHVLGGERQESTRVDRQLAGRCARQGDPGVAQFFVSAEDDLIRRYTAPWEVGAFAAALDRESSEAAPWARRLVAMAQAQAESEASKARRSVLTNDTWLEDSLGFGFNELGGR